MNLKRVAHHKRTKVTRILTPSQSAGLGLTPEKRPPLFMEEKSEQEQVKTGRSIREGTRFRHWASDPQAQKEILDPVRRSRRGATE